MSKNDFPNLQQKSEASGLPIHYQRAILVFPKNYKPDHVFRKECKNLLKAHRKEPKLPALYGILQLQDYSTSVFGIEKKQKEALYCLAKYYICYAACAANREYYIDKAKAEIKKLESYDDKSLKRKIEYLEKALEIIHKMEFNDRNDQIQSFVSALMVDSSVQSLGRERVTYDYDSAYSSSSSSSSSDSSEEKEEYKEVKTTYINFRDGSKGVVVDDDSLSSYKGQLVVNEYTKEPTGMRYKATTSMTRTETTSDGSTALARSIRETD